MSMDSMRKQTYQCEQYKAKNCLQNMTAETLKLCIFLKKTIKFLALVKTFPLMYQLLL